MSDPITKAAELVRSSRRILFITGAGLAADSGLPTYRGVGGLYEDKETDEGIPIEVALSGEMMEQAPSVCWKYIAQVEAACRGAKPNRAHEVIAWLETKKEVVTLTQNVDGLHRSAGAKNVIEIHGDVHRLACTSCPFEERVENYAGLEIPPSCARCGSLVRPRVVLFGEALPHEEVARLMDELQRGFDLVFSVGTTSVFPYISGPVLEARARGVPTIEINPGWTEVSPVVSIRVAERAAVALDEIWRRAGL
jgi:NAD-dependent deacetylase